LIFSSGERPRALWALLFTNATVLFVLLALFIRMFMCCDYTDNSNGVMLKAMGFSWEKINEILTYIHTYIHTQCLKA